MHVISDVVVTPPDPGTITPEEDPLLAGLNANAFLPLVVAGESSSFDGSDSSGNPTHYTWDFGDGTQADGASTEKTFTDAGTYPVTLTVTNDSGVTDSVTSSITVTKPLADIASEANLTADNDTMTFDLGNPVPGLEYQWEFLDTTNPNAVPETRSGSRVTEQFKTLGTYTVSVRVLDYRDQLVTQSQTPNQTRTRATRDALAPDPEDQFDRTLYKAQSWVTRWELRPQAKLQALSSSTTPGGWREAMFGRVGKDSPSYTINFDASHSTGVNLKYTWKICQIVEGVCNTVTTMTGEKPSYNFSNPGEYGVSLHITDKYEQISDAQGYVVIKNADTDFTISRLLFPTHELYSSYAGGADLPPTPTPDPTPPDSNLPDGVPPSPTTGSGPEYHDTFFPFVLHRSVKFQRAGIRWNDWDSHIFRKQLCKSIKAFYSNDNYTTNDERFPQLYQSIEYAPGTFEYTYDPVFGATITEATPGTAVVSDTFCDLATLKNVDIPSMGARSDAALTITGAHNVQRTYFDIPYDYRVPKIVMAVLPDEMLPGDSNQADASIPMVEENITSVHGEDQLVLTVRMRESEFKRTNSRLEFDVPVYAVDRAGQRMLNTNGMFFGHFDGSGFESNCGDCVMRNGKAYVHVSLDPRLYNTESSRTFDLNNLVLSDDSLECDSYVESPISKKLRIGSIGGCSIIPVTSKIPVGEEVAPRVTYSDVEIATNFFGVTLYGDQAEAAQKFFHFAMHGFSESLLTFILDNMPVVGAIRAIMRAGPGLLNAIGDFISLSVNCAVTGQPDPTRPPPKVYGGSGAPQCDVFSFLILGADIAQNAGQLAGAALEGIALLHTAQHFYKDSVVAQEVQARFSPSTTPITRAAGNLAKLLQKEVLDLSKR